MDVPARCTLCRNVVDVEDLFCASCGREVEPAAGGAPAAPALEQGLVGFDCRGCGASLTYDAGAQALRCAFCGSTSLERQAGTTGRVPPSSRIPFTVDEDHAVQAFRAWVGRGLFRPRRVQQEVRLEVLQSVYVPCWVFSGTTETCWTADTDRTPPFARADWCPVSGESPGAFEGVLVPASGSLEPRELERLLPYDFAAAVPYRREEVADLPVEDVGVSRRGARPAARARIEELERERCARLVPGRSRNVHVNVLIRDMASEPVLLPVWINAYRWRERVYRFVINGQTGEVVGRAPVSRAKVALAVVLALAVIALVVLAATR